MGEFSGLSYGQIENIANTLNSKADAMNSLLNEISTQLKKVGSDGTWSGTSASASLEEFEKLMAKFPEFVDAVKSCSTKLNSVVSTYKAVDQKVMGL